MEAGWRANLLWCVCAFSSPRLTAYACLPLTVPVFALRRNLLHGTRKVRLCQATHEHDCLRSQHTRLLHSLPGAVFERQLQAAFSNMLPELRTLSHCPHLGIDSLFVSAHIPAARVCVQSATPPRRGCCRRSQRRSRPSTERTVLCRTQRRRRRARHPQKAKHHPRLRMCGKDGQMPRTWTMESRKSNSDRMTKRDWTWERWGCERCARTVSVHRR